MRPGTLLLAGLAAGLTAGGAACGSPASQPAAGPAPAPTSAAQPAARSPAARRGAIVYQPMARTAYLIQRRDSVTVQLPNGLPQTQELTRTVYLSVASAAGSPMRVSITLDSLLVTGVGMSQASADSARGTSWTGTLEDGVRLGTLTPSSRHALETAGERVARPGRNAAAWRYQGGSRLDRYHKDHGAGGGQ